MVWLLSKLKNNENGLLPTPFLKKYLSKLKTESGLVFLAKLETEKNANAENDKLLGEKIYKNIYKKPFVWVHTALGAASANLIIF